MNVLSPWPEKEKFYKFLIRPSFHVRVAYMVDHDQSDTTPKEPRWQWWALRQKFKATWGKWPFFSLRLGRFGFYIGFKPINLEDPHFVRIPPDFDRSCSCCEFSVRWSNSRNKDTDNG